MEEKNFFDKVYEIVRMIPQGKVATYGQIARMCFAPRSSRAVGYALHVNPMVLKSRRIFSKKRGYLFFAKRTECCTSI